jgi:hypothetical protein
MFRILEEHQCTQCLISSMGFAGHQAAPVGRTSSLHYYYSAFVVLAYLAYLRAVNTSYRSSLGTTDPGIQALIALDWLFGNSERHSLSPSIHQQDQFSFDRITTDLMSPLDIHKVRLIISKIHSNPGL